MTTPTILKSHSGADFLAILPTLAGFAPHDSVLVVPFHGKRTMGVMRMDLPRATSRDDHSRLCAVALGAMSRLTRCDGVALVVYADEPFAVAFAAWEDLIDRLADRFDSAGFAVKDTLCAAADGWASWGESDVPLSGHPLCEVSDNPLAVQAAALRAADTPIADGDDALSPVDPAARSRVSDAVSNLVVHGRATDAFGVTVAAELPVAGEVVERMLCCPDAPTMPESLIVQIAAISLNPSDREEAMIHIAFGRKTAGHAHAHGTAKRRRTTVAETHARGRRRAVPECDAGEHRPSPRTAALLRGRSTQAPDAQAIRHVLPLLGRTAAHVGPMLRPDLFCMLAWLHWAVGSGSRAGRWVDEALRILPGHKTASILRTVVGSGTLPDWVYAQHDAAVDAGRS